MWNYFVIFLLALTGFADETFYQGKLDQFQSFSTFDLSSLKGQISLVYFFQPACESCAQQTKDLNCLPPEMPVVAVGVLGSFQSLKKEFRRHMQKKTGPKTIGIYGGSLFQSRWAIRQTPTLLGFDSKGQQLFRINHRIKCEELQKLFEESLQKKSAKMGR